MIGDEPSNLFRTDAGFQGAPDLALDAEFASRWTAWVERGRVHEQRVRRKVIVWAGVIATGAAIAYGFLRP